MHGHDAYYKLISRDTVVTAMVAGRVADGGVQRLGDRRLVTLTFGEALTVNDAEFVVLENHSTEKIAFVEIRYSPSSYRETIVKLEAEYAAQKAENAALKALVKQQADHLAKLTAKS